MIVPDTLRPFNKFASNPKLCTDWDKLWTSWLLAYPMISLRDQLGYAHAWLLANPKRDKKNYARFLNNWFRSAHDRAKLTGGARAPITKPRHYENEIPADDVMSGDDWARMKQAIMPRRLGGI